ncbi:hypothetical protein D3C73_608340 [compost metagenome]
MAIRSLDEVDHHRPVTKFRHVAKFFQMLGAALGDRIGKFGQSRLPTEMDVLHLHIGIRQAVAFQQEIDPRIAAVFLLP